MLLARARLRETYYSPDKGFLPYISFIIAEAYIVALKIATSSRGEPINEFLTSLVGVFVADVPNGVFFVKIREEAALNTNL